MKDTISNIYKSLLKGISEREARIILKERANIEWSDIIAKPDSEVDDTQILADLVAFKSGKPLSKIYGHTEFYGRRFKVTEHTLDPRPDSETLIEAIFSKKQKPNSILDLGTGTGCLLLTLLAELPNASGTGVDISVDALGVAKDNAKSLNLDSRAAFVQSNWAESIDQKYDLVISNPPYIESNVIPTLDSSVKNHDPILALDGGQDGLNAYRTIFSQLDSVLNADGFCIVEIGFDQAESVPRLIEEQGLIIGSVMSDLAGNPRAVDIYLNEKTRRQWG